MNERVRANVFLVAGCGLLALLVWAALGLPGLGRYPGPYGDVLNHIAVYERHATDVVTAVNFDYRGVDTMGEEFILFTSVIAVMFLLRDAESEGEAELADERRDHLDGRKVPPTSDAVRTMALGLIGATVTFGLYIVMHGQLTPGGGFQGGVILATVPLFVYLAGDFKKFIRIAPEPFVQIGEALGAAGYVIIGLLALLFGGNFLQNWAWLGKTGEVNSSGTILLLNMTTGLEVAGGFVLILYMFLLKTLRQKSSSGKNHGSK